MREFGVAGKNPALGVSTLCNSCQSGCRPQVAQPTPPCQEAASVTQHQKDYKDNSQRIAEVSHTGHYFYFCTAWCFQCLATGCYICKTSVRLQPKSYHVSTTIWVQSHSSTPRTSHLCSKPSKLLIMPFILSVRGQGKFSIKRDKLVNQSDAGTNNQTSFFSSPPPEKKIKKKIHTDTSPLVLPPSAEDLLRKADLNQLTAL